MGGTSVYCRRSTDEDGVPLVHIHGFAISGAYLMPTARALATRGVNVVPDLPGYGRSERRDRVLDIPALAETTLAILDRLDIDKAVLVGNSMGCAISLEVAHEAPERIHSLVLVSPAGGVHNQPMSRALGQLAKDVFRESTKMFPVALPDYVKFGPTERPAPLPRVDTLPVAGAPASHPRPDPCRPGGPRPTHAVTRPHTRSCPTRSGAPDGRDRGRGSPCGELQSPHGAGRRDRGVAGPCSRRPHASPRRSAGGCVHVALPSVDDSLTRRPVDRTIRRPPPASHRPGRPGAGHRDPSLRLSPQGCRPSGGSPQAVLRPLVHTGAHE